MKARPLARILAIALLSATAGHAQFENLDLSSGAVGEMPTGWHFGPEGTSAYAAQIAAGAACSGGKQCAAIRSLGLGPHERCFLYQNVDATPYRSKVLLYRAEVRMTG